MDLAKELLDLKYFTDSQQSNISINSIQELLSRVDIKPYTKKFLLWLYSLKTSSNSTPNTICKPYDNKQIFTIAKNNSIVNDQPKILVIQLTRLGDMIQTLPCIADLKSFGFHITLLAYKEFASIINETKLIDRICFFSYHDIISVLFDNITPISFHANKFIEAINKLCEFILEYDAILNVSHDISTAHLIHLIPAKHRYGYSIDNNSIHIVTGQYSQYLFNLVLQRNLNALNLVDIYRGSAKEIAFQLNSSNKTRTDNSNDLYNTKSDFLAWPSFCQIYTQPKIIKLLQQFENNIFIAIHPGASKDNKRWPFFHKLVSIFLETKKAHVIILGLESESKLALEIENEIKDQTLKKYLHNLTGKTTLEELPHILRNAKLLIGNDSGLIHIAASVGTPVLNLCVGPVYFKETGPYGNDHIIVSSAIYCHPCSLTTTCNINEACKNDISPEFINQLINIIISFENKDLQNHEIRKLIQSEELSKQQPIPCKIYRSYIDTVFIKQQVQLLTTPISTIDLVLSEIYSLSIFIITNYNLMNNIDSTKELDCTEYISDNLGKDIKAFLRRIFLQPDKALSSQLDSIYHQIKIYIEDLKNIIQLLQTIEQGYADDQLLQYFNLEITRLLDITSSSLIYPLRNDLDLKLTRTRLISSNIENPVIPSSAVKEHLYFPIVALYTLKEYIKLID